MQHLENEPTRPRVHNESRARQVEAHARELRQLAPAAANLELDRLVKALCGAARLLRDDDAPLTRELRQALLESTGLSPAMIEWGLTTTLRSVQPAVVRSLMAPVHGIAAPHALVAVVLAGNVFSAAVRALFLPLLTGACVLAKASSSEGVLPRALKAALDAVDPEIGERLRVVQFERADQAAGDALLTAADAISIYGDDATVRELRQRASPRTTVIAHGHGLSAGYIGNEVLFDARSAHDAAQRLALDIAAYDQRGCLSPHVLLIERGGRIDARAFAEVLANSALPMLEELLPSGERGTEERAAVLQWRAVAASRGELFASYSHAVSYEGNATPRPSAGARTLSVYDCERLEALPNALAEFAPYLKSVGVAGPASERLRVSDALRPIATPRICRLGEMQTPRFDVYADGHPPLHGLLRFKAV